MEMVVERENMEHVSQPNQDPTLLSTPTVPAQVPMVADQFPIHGSQGDSGPLPDQSATTHRATLQHNEIKKYLNCRYVSPPEALWRLNKYRLHEHSHTIVRLPVHLPNQQMVYFREGMLKNTH